MVKTRKRKRNPQQNERGEDQGLHPPLLLSRRGREDRERFQPHPPRVAVRSENQLNPSQGKRRKRKQLMIRRKSQDGLES